MRTSLAASLLLTAWAWAVPANAEEPSQPASPVTASLESAVVFGMADSRSWLGRADGMAPQIGFGLRGGLEVLAGPHDWWSALDLGASIAVAPHGEAVIKGSDGLALESVYHHAITAWFAPFARVSARASLLRAEDVRSQATTYRIRRASGATERVEAERFVLTDPLRPLTLKQSLGGSIRAVRTAPIAIDIRGGLGGRETLADGQLAATDRRETPAVELTEARDAWQLGGETAVVIDGRLADARIGYRLTAEALVPFTSTTPLPGEEDAEGFERVTAELGTVISLHLAPWLSFEYGFGAVRDPLVLRAFQYQNILLVSVGAPAIELP